METEKYDDDPIVVEIDVILSKQLMNSLFIFQYPVRPVHLLYSNTTYLDARMKPNQKTVELEIALKTFGKNYEINLGEQWAIDVDGKEPTSACRFFKTDKMDKQILSSSPVGIDAQSFSIGVFRNAELHLTPLSGILQLRPNLSYIDRMDARRTKAKITDGESDEDSLVPVMAKYAAKENEEARSRRLASFEFLRNQQDDESWIQMRHRSLVGIDKCCLEKNLLYADRNVFHPESEFYMPLNEYLDHLIPIISVEAKSNQLLPSNVISMADIKLKPVADQVRILLECAKVMKFGKLVSILSKDCDASNLIRNLQQVGILVKGCWVYKSELLYTPEKCGGVDAELMIRVRDFVLWTFTQNKTITRKELASVAKLPPEEEKELLSKIAKQRMHSRDWEFIMDEDDEFAFRNPEVVQRQTRIWEKKHAQICAFIKEKKTSTVSKSQRIKSGDKLSESDTDGAELTNPVLVNNLASEFVESIPTSILSCNKQLNEQTKRKVSFSLDTEPPIKNISIFKEDTVSTSAANFSINSSSNLSPITLLPLNKDTENMKNLLDSIKSLFIQRSVLQLSELRFQLTLQPSLLQHIIHDITDEQLEIAAVTIGATKHKANSNILFISEAKGDHLDSVRKILVKQLLLNPKMFVKIGTFKKELEDNAIICDENEMRIVLREYCTVKSNKWYLKNS